MQTSDATRRENADLYPITKFHRHAPRRRGIQYSAASERKHYRLWNTGSSAFADDDSGELFDN
jgi:hypothetical protein